MASIAFTSVWSFEMAVPIVSTMVPPELRLKISSPNLQLVVVPSTVFTASFAAWMRVTCGMAARCTDDAT